MKNNPLPKSIPAGFVLRIAHGGKPELRAIDTKPEPQNQAAEATARKKQRRALLARARRLGIVGFDSPIESWSIEHLQGAIFERTCTWYAARRAGLRGINRRWSNHAFFVAMVKAKRFGNNKQHRQ